MAPNPDRHDEVSEITADDSIDIDSSKRSAFVAVANAIERDDGRVILWAVDPIQPERQNRLR